MSSKFETNWCDLPNEMQLECIKRMDFKTRMRLRATSKHGKELVESAKKYQFDFVGMFLDLRYGLKVVYKELQRSEVVKRLYCKENTTRELFEKAVHLVIQILKFSSTETIDFDSNFGTDKAVSNFLDNFTDSMTFRFEKIALYCNKLKIVQFFLKKCESADTVRIFRPLYGNYDDFMDILQLPVIINAKQVELMNLDEPGTLYQLINNWLEKDNLELGKTIKMSSCTTEPTDVLAEKFENRVVSKTDKILRIRSNDATKHIFINWNFSWLTILALVIPSNQKESE